MSTLAITKAYASGNALTEAHIDNFRSALHTFLNTTKLTAENFTAAIALTGSKFSDDLITSTDNSYIDFGTDGDAWFGLDSSKDLVFDTDVATTEIQFWAGATYYLEIYTDKVYVPGDIILAKGGANRTILQALSSYKKPVLQWAGSDAISIECNSSDSSETVLFFPGYFLAAAENLGASAKYRQASINATANGYGSAHTGAVKGGRRSGVSLTTNSWYAVYAVGLRSGTEYNADSLKFILVFDDTLPTSDNDSTLDGYYGQYNWVYLGLVRYGYGDDGTTSSIIKFVQSKNGWCYFYGTDGGATHGGLTLEQSTSNTDDTSTPLYTFSQGMTGQKIPSTVSHIAVAVSRGDVSDWYLKLGSDIVWRPGWQTDETLFDHGHVIELPYQAYTVHQERKGTTAAVDKRVCLAGYCDGYLALRRHGHGF